MDTSQDRERLTELYKKLYEMTNPVCSTKCKLPRSCCSPEYCHIAMNWAKEKWNTELKPTGHPKLPLMGEQGCIAAPQYRPMCTAHVCEMTLYAQGQAYWDEYWSVRNEIDEIEWKSWGP